MGSPPSCSAWYLAYMVSRCTFYDKAHFLVGQEPCCKHSEEREIHLPYGYIRLGLHLPPCIIVLVNKQNYFKIKPGLLIKSSVQGQRNDSVVKSTIFPPKESSSVPNMYTPWLSTNYNARFVESDALFQPLRIPELLSTSPHRNTLAYTSFKIK